MEPTHSTGSESVVGSLLTVITTLSTAVVGWYAMWSAPVNGDEGYLLLSLREWVLRGGLYDSVYSQYGPFYYALFGLPSRVLGDAWGISAGRVTSLMLWVAAAWLFGVAVRALTGRWIFGIAAQVLTFSMLSTLLNEPMHPGGLLCALLAAELANMAWLRRRSATVSDVLSGAVAAALLLVKVNVGIFMIVALVFVVCEASRSRGWRFAASGALVALGPILLLANGQEDGGCSGLRYTPPEGLDSSSRRGCIGRRVRCRSIDAHSPWASAS